MPQPQQPQQKPCHSHHGMAATTMPWLQQPLCHSMLQQQPYHAMARTTPCCSNKHVCHAAAVKTSTSEHGNNNNHNKTPKPGENSAMASATMTQCHNNKNKKIRFIVLSLY